MFTANPLLQNPSRSPDRPLTGDQPTTSALNRSDGAIEDEFMRNLIPPTRISVLLIDDQSMVSELVQRSLSKETDIEFHYCNDPTMAITMAIDLAPTVILQDLVMPDVDGLMLLRWFRLNPVTKEIPMIVLSCKEDAHLKAEAFTHGANDYLIKLPDAVELVARIRYHSQAYHNLQALKATTNAAQEQSQQLAKTLTQVQEMQTQIIQSEKMTGLGRMVAGIAHEINNPINFIHGNVKHMGGYLNDLLELVDRYQAAYPEPTASITQYSEQIDFSFLRSDLPKLMQSMQSGSERIRNTVLSLRNFSRLDESDKKVVSLEDGIDSTLTLLSHRLKSADGIHQINVQRHYTQVPKIECYPAQLNQVFMHLLNNAIDALEGQFLHEQPKIIITTEIVDDIVKINVQDNGIGIPLELHDRIFEPFFTTKSINQGTGLGLAICYQIVQKHLGSIAVQSTPGKGSLFMIKLPVQNAVS